MEQSQNQVFKSYRDFWTRTLDVSGRSSRADFWHPFWINFIITSLLGIFSVGLLSRFIKQSFCDCNYYSIIHCDGQTFT